MRRGLGPFPLVCMVILLSCLPCRGAGPAPPVARDTSRTDIPRSRLNYRNAIRGLSCRDLGRLRLKMEKRLQASGTSGERGYYQGFLEETETMMMTTACTVPKQ